jgi:hypothetical protein
MTKTLQATAGQPKWNWLLHTTPLILLCLIAQATPVFGFTFNVPLVSLTNHNSSAFSNYNENTYGANFGTTSWADTNGGLGGTNLLTIDPAQIDESLNPITPGHVSYTDVHTLIPSRPDLRWFPNVLGWFGEGSHIDIGVNNNTTAYAAALVQSAESRGFNGLIYSWYGKGDQTDDVALKVQTYLQSSANTNKNFKYIIMFVMGFFKGGESLTNVETNLLYCKNQYFSDTNYETDPVVGGNPLVMFFNVSPAYLSESDMETAKAATVPNSLWVQEGVGEITQPWVDMTYFWTDSFDQGTPPPVSDPFNLSAVTNQYSTVKSNPTKQSFGAMCGRFNGTLTKELRAFSI